MHIQETIAHAGIEDHVEAVTFDIAAGKLALVRSRHLPEFAFLVWADNSIRRGSTFSWLNIAKREYKQGHQVFCPCCGHLEGKQYEGETATEDYTLWCKRWEHFPYHERPRFVGETETEGYKAWKLARRVEFAQKLVTACREHDIATVFVRDTKHAELMRKQLRGFPTACAWLWEDAVLEMYGRKAIREHMNFFDPESLGAG